LLRVVLGYGLPAKSRSQTRLKRLMRHVAAIILSSATFTTNVCEEKMEREILKAWCVFILIIAVIVGVCNAF
jgi:hypothetical protein